MASSIASATGRGGASAATGIAEAESTPVRSDLHCSQKRAPSSFSKWQKGQMIIETPLLNSA